MPWSALGALALVALTTSLGFWQLNRAQEMIEIGERLQQIRAAPPLSIAAGEINPAAYDLRRIIAEGVFDRASTIYLDNKVREGTAGYEVISLLKMESGRKPVLVNRGWAAQGATREVLPSVPTPEGEVTIQGVAMVPSGKVLELSDQTIEGRVWQNLNLARYREVYGVDVQPFILLQESEAPDGLARDWRPRDTGADKHRAYAVQWFALAVLTIIFYFAVGRKT
ncbi:MAG: SURF1 family protein [Burkholderiales bacterium]